MTGPQGVGPLVPGGGTPGFPGGGGETIGVTINQHIEQTDPAFTLPVRFTVVFDEPVTGFGPSDVVISGSAGFVDCNVSGVGTTYIVSVPKAPTVTINKGASQADPATGGSVVFDVVFSDVVTGFTNADVILSGTAGATTCSVTGSGAIYTVTVTGITASGTVIADIPAGAAIFAGTVTNEASTSTDNIVAYTSVLPASGGTITTVGAYTYHTFLSNGTFDPASRAPLAVDYFYIGGGSGGSGGTSSVNYGSAGAGGTARSGSTTLSTPQTITIGAGGAGAVATSTAGGTTTLGSIGSATGGTAVTTGRTGGSNADFSGGTGPSDNYSSGGGAGAGAVGGTNGVGGVGVQWPSGSGSYYGGGGGGISGTTAQAGGNGGGATGSTTTANAATVNKGAGGGGGPSGSGGGAGSSGLAIVRYLT